MGATGGVGEVVSCRVLRDEQGASRGVGLARMESPELCQTIISNLNNKTLPGMLEPLRVKYANGPSPRRYSFVHRSSPRRPSSAAGGGPGSANGDYGSLPPAPYGLGSVSPQPPGMASGVQQQHSHSPAGHAQVQMHGSGYVSPDGYGPGSGAAAGFQRIAGYESPFPFGSAAGDPRLSRHEHPIAQAHPHPHHHHHAAAAAAFEHGSSGATASVCTCSVRGRLVLSRCGLGKGNHWEAGLLVCSVLLVVGLDMARLARDRLRLLFSSA